MAPGMANSLQDQLVAAGLAEPGQARKRGRGRKDPAAGGKPRAKGKGKGKRGSRARGRDGGRDGAADTPARGEGADTATPATASAPRGGRATIARLRQLVAAHRLPRKDADVPYRFTSGQRIKEITVTREQRARLARGEAAIVNVQGRYDVVPAAAVAAIRALDGGAVAMLNDPAEPGDGGDDPCADRPVPDDLTW